MMSMMSPVMLVLSALMVTMVSCSGDEEADPNYPAGGMDGKWYIVGYATNGWTAYAATTNRAVYVAQTNNRLNWTFSEPKPTDPTECENTTRHLIKLANGVFEDVDNGYEVVVLNYTTSYAVIHTAEGDEDGGHDGDDPCINELYSSTSTPAPDDVWNEFVQLSWEDDKIPPSNVHRLANNGQC